MQSLMQWNSSPFSRLEGSFRRGLANGRGTLKTAAEDKIEGDFVDHMPHGKVLMQRPNGERIEGQFRQVLQFAASTHLPVNFVAGCTQL